MTAQKSTPREWAVAFPRTLRHLAEEAAAHPNASDKEKKVLREAVEQLDMSSERLANIFAAHDALLMGDDWREPFDPDSPIHLAIALAAAFTIGGRVISNPIVGQARAAHARQKRELESKKIDAVILRHAERLWAQNATAPNSAGFTAAEIIDAVNRELPRPLKKRALESRLHKHMMSRTIR